MGLCGHKDCKTECARKVLVMRANICEGIIYNPSPAATIEIYGYIGLGSMAKCTSPQVRSTVHSEGFKLQGTQPHTPKTSAPLVNLQGSAPDDNEPI